MIFACFFLHFDVATRKFTVTYVGYIFDSCRRSAGQRC